MEKGIPLSLGTRTESAIKKLDGKLHYGGREYTPNDLKILALTFLGDKIGVNLLPPEIGIPAISDVIHVVRQDKLSQSLSSLENVAKIITEHNTNIVQVSYDPHSGQILDMQDGVGSSSPHKGHGKKQGKIVMHEMADELQRKSVSLKFDKGGLIASVFFIEDGIEMRPSQYAQRGMLVRHIRVLTSLADYNKRIIDGVASSQDIDPVLLPVSHREIPTVRFVINGQIDGVQFDVKTSHFRQARKEL